MRYTRRISELTAYAQYAVRIESQLLTAEEERTASVDTLVRHNLLLVAHVVRKFCATMHHPDADALISVGNAALVQAAMHYRSELGYRFSTYAHRAIWARLCRQAVEEQQLVKLPCYVRGAATLKTDGGRRRRVRMQERVTRLQRMSRSMDVLDAQVAPSAYVEPRVDVEGMLACLDERSRKVVRAHFIEGRTFKSMTGELGLSKQGVCRVAQQALMRLRDVVDKHVTYTSDDGVRED